MGAEVKGTINSEATHLRKTRNTTIVTGLWLQQALCLCLEQQDNLVALVKTIGTQKCFLCVFRFWYFSVLLLC